MRLNYNEANDYRRTLIDWDLHRLRNERRTKTAECRSILDAGDDRDGRLTTDEQKRYDRLLGEAEVLRDEAEDRERRAGLPLEDGLADGATIRPRNGGNELRALRPGELRILEPDQQFGDCPELRSQLPDGIRPDELSAGRCVKGMVTGDWKGCEAEQRAMAGADDVLGGFALPDTVSANIIDMVRNRARVIQAGARTVPMENATLAIAIQESDPTGAWKAENQAITLTDVQFGKLTLSAKTLAALIPLSVELAEDAENVDTLVRRALADALTVQLDLALLRGAGNALTPTGIRNVTGIQTIDMGTNGAAMTGYDEFVDAWTKVVEVNGPDAGLGAIFSTREAGFFMKLKDAQGQPVKPPEAIERMRKFSTNQVPINLTKGTSSDASEAYVGNFTEILVGMRQRVMIEATRVGAAVDASSNRLGFESGSVLVRAMLRADMGIVRANQLVLIDGIIP